MALAWFALSEDNTKPPRSEEAFSVGEEALERKVQDAEFEMSKVWALICLAIRLRSAVLWRCARP